MKNKLYAVLAFLIGGFCLYSGVQERMAISKLKKIGERTEVATPESYTERRKSGSSTYTAEFEFEAANGRKVKQKKSFPKELIADFENGEPVFVLYDPSDPTEFVFEKQEPEWLLILFGVVFMAGGAWYGLRKSEPARDG